MRSPSTESLGKQGFVRQWLCAMRSSGHVSSSPHLDKQARDDELFEGNQSAEPKRWAFSANVLKKENSGRSLKGHILNNDDHEALLRSSGSASLGCDVTAHRLDSRKLRATKQLSRYHVSRLSRADFHRTSKSARLATHNVATWGDGHCRQSPSRKYARRRRHKTRLDKYDYRGNARNMKSDGIDRRQERGVKLKRQNFAAASNQEFKASNVEFGRLKSDRAHRRGPIVQSRSLAVTEHRDVPDLTFPDMKFLSWCGRTGNNTTEQVSKTRSKPNRSVDQAEDAVYHIKRQESPRRSKVDKHSPRFDDREDDDYCRKMNPQLQEGRGSTSSTDLSMLDRRRQRWSTKSLKSFTPRYKQLVSCMVPSQPHSVRAFPSLTSVSDASRSVSLERRAHPIHVPLLANLLSSRNQSNKFRLEIKVDSDGMSPEAYTRKALIRDQPGKWLRERSPNDLSDVSITGLKKLARQISKKHRGKADSRVGLDRPQFESPVESMCQSETGTISPESCFRISETSLQQDKMKYGEKFEDICIKGSLPELGRETESSEVAQSYRLGNLFPDKDSLNLRTKNSAARPTPAQQFRSLKKKCVTGSATNTSGYSSDEGLHRWAADVSSSCNYEDSGTRGLAFLKGTGLSEGHLQDGIEWQAFVRSANPKLHCSQDLSMESNVLDMRNRSPVLTKGDHDLEAKGYGYGTTPIMQDCARDINRLDAKPCVTVGLPVSRKSPVGYGLVRFGKCHYSGESETAVRSLLHCRSHPRDNMHDEAPFLGFSRPHLLY